MTDKLPFRNSPFDQFKQRCSQVPYNQLEPEEKLQIQWMYALGVPLEYKIHSPDTKPRLVFSPAHFNGNWNTIRRDLWFFFPDD